MDQWSDGYLLVRMPAGSPGSPSPRRYVVALCFRTVDPDCPYIWKSAVGETELSAGYALGRACATFGKGESVQAVCLTTDDAGISSYSVSTIGDIDTYQHTGSPLVKAAGVLANSLQDLLRVDASVVAAGFPRPAKLAA